MREIGPGLQGLDRCRGVHQSLFAIRAKQAASGLVCQRIQIEDIRESVMERWLKALLCCATVFLDRQFCP